MSTSIPRPLPAGELRLTSFSHGGGCGCKIAPGVLSEILRSSGGGIVPPELMVGIETADDAAVYKLNDEQALIATTDFFMPIVDDPFDFGRIAATNARMARVSAAGRKRGLRASHAAFRVARKAGCAAQRRMSLANASGRPTSKYPG